MTFNQTVLTKGTIHLTRVSVTRGVMVFVVEYKGCFYVSTAIFTETGMEHDECFDCQDRDDAMHYATVQYE